MNAEQRRKAGVAEARTSILRFLRALRCSASMRFDLISRTVKSPRSPTIV